ncbi:VWA domain-containing protein [Chloroflexi bacterium TSY]|nr:VWA domain-containing protein [Chloroflexi bacterium TSY]
MASFAFIAVLIHEDNLMKLIRSKFPIKLSAVRIRRRLITIMVHLTLLFTLATALQAGSKPDFLSNAVSGIPAGGLTYEVWFTNTCIPDTTGTCKCDAGVDKQNDCVSTIDTDGDGILDSGPDEDGDGVVDVVDLDFTTNWGNWATVPNVESVSFNLQRSVDVYVNDWGLRQPFWTEVTERDVYVYDIDSRGSASSDGSGIELNTATMLKTAPGPRSTVLHEVWHAVQHAYNATSGVDDWFVEGQARFMQDKVFFDMDVNAGSRYVGAVKNYLKNPTVPKDFDANADGKENTVPVGLLGAKYEAALWWTYLTEQAGSGFVGTAGEGIEFIEDVLEWSPDPLNIKGQLAVDLTLLARIGRSFDLSFWDFTIANYTKDYNVATLDRSLIDDRDPQIVLDYQDELSGEYGAVAKAEEFTDSELMIGQGGRVDPVTYTAVASIPPTLEVTGEMPQYGALYYEGELPDAATCPVAHWAAAGDANSRLYHSWVLRAQSPTVGAPDDLVDLQRHHGEEFSITLLNRDEYTYMTGIVASNHAPEGFDWTMWCSSTPPDLTITGPHVDAPAAVGDPADAGRFKVWLAVTDGSLDDPISGLDWEQDFAVTVGGEEAEILNGEEVGNEYWLVVQAPNVPNTTLGDTHDLHVELVMGGADDDAPNAVLYDIIPKDQVLVIDRSASMNQGSKFTAAKSAARIYADTTQLGDQLGVVSFSDAATTVFPLTPIQDQNDNAGDRASARLAIDAIPLGNQTSIGAGLAQGQALLSTVPSGNIWNMVLLSDGEENVSPSVDAVIGNIASAGTKVHAIAFGPESDTELMRSIAAATCGLREEDHCFHALNANATGMLVHAAAQDQQQQLNDLADIYRQIGDSVHGHQRLWQGSSATVSGSSFSVKIDETGGREGFFAFNWADPANALNVTITGPAGITFTQLEDGQNHTVFYVNEVKAGKYQVDLGGSGNWVGSLSARVVKGTELHAYAHTPSDSSRVLGMPIQLQVSLTDDNGPAAGAAVTAVVGRPGGVEETITLYDGKAPTMMRRMMVSMGTAMIASTSARGRKRIASTTPLPSVLTEIPLTVTRCSPIDLVMPSTMIAIRTTYSTLGNSAMRIQTQPWTMMTSIRIMTA